MKNKDDKARKKLEKTRKRFLKLRKNHAWVTVLMFLIISFVAAISVTMFAAVFTGFSVNATIENQYEAKKMLADAAKDAGVRLRQIEERRQSPDHPVLWGVPETEYLKFLIFQVV